MTAFRLTHLSTVLVAVASFFLSAQNSVASEQALVNLEFKQLFFGYTYYSWTGNGTATLNTSVASPTPPVVFPANIVSGPSSVVGGVGPYTPNFSVFATVMNGPGALSKSHAGAAPIGGSTVLPAAATTKCFASVGPFAPGPPALPGSCFPRGAQANRTPGSKSYGGTARLLRSGVANATRTNFSVGGFDLTNAKIGDTRAGPMGVGNYGVIGSGTLTNTVTGASRKTFLFQTEAPFTTGVVVAASGSYGTNFPGTGSHMLNTAAKTGTISLVRPFLNNKFSRDQAGTLTGRVFAIAGIEQLKMTFLPEPAVAIQAAFGVLGLGALCARRIRRR